MLWRVRGGSERSTSTLSVAPATTTRSVAPALAFIDRRISDKNKTRQAKHYGSNSIAPRGHGDCHFLHSEAQQSKAQHAEHAQHSPSESNLDKGYAQPRPFPSTSSTSSSTSSLSPISTPGYNQGLSRWLLFTKHQRAPHPQWRPAAAVTLSACIIASARRLERVHSVSSSKAQIS